LTSAHENNLKTSKKKLIWSKEKNKKILNFFKNTLKTQKQTGPTHSFIDPTAASRLLSLSSNLKVLCAMNSLLLEEKIPSVWINTMKNSYFQKIFLWE